MKHYLYSYQTILRYEQPIKQHHFKLRCLPVQNGCQQIIKQHFSVTPKGRIWTDTDTWGNSVQYGSREGIHTSFIFVSSGYISLSPYAIPSAGAEVVFTVPSALTAVSPMMSQFAWHTKRSFTALDRVLYLSDKLYNYMHYTTGATHSTTTAMQAFAGRHGVCQDYAHILIALCRYEGIAARYVNGLIFGQGETHAWVEVYIDGVWRGIDPTHNRLIEYGYIKIAHGRDAADCPVNRGVFTGKCGVETDIRVIVEEL